MDPRGHRTPSREGEPVASALAQAVDAVEALGDPHVDPGPLRAAADALAAPRRIAVVGRVGVGKSRLVSRATGVARPTGLGGVTREVAEIDDGAARWIDTPGIDDPDDAVRVLAPLLEDVDGAVWITDGLQPMTASERAVIDLAVPPGLPVWVCVSRKDLIDPDELASVEDRVRVLAAVLAPRAVRAVDLRVDPVPEVLGDLGATAWSPRRRAALAESVARVRGAMERRGPPTDPDALAARWRAGVRALVASIDDRVRSGALGTAAGAEAALVAEAGTLTDEIRARGGPSLPLPVAVSRSGLGRAFDVMAGADGARRALKAAAGRWLAEGEGTLRDDWPGSTAARRESERWSATIAALDAVDRALEALATV